MLGAIFWASFFILLGVSIVLKAVFNIHIPVAQVFIAVFFIYLGMSILVGKSYFKQQVKVFTVKKGEADHVVVFSKHIIDLTHLKEGRKKELEAVVVFGEALFKLDENRPTKIVVKGAFSGIRFPGADKSGALMGKSIYTTPEYDPDKDHLELEVTTVFANVRFIAE